MREGSEAALDEHSAKALPRVWKAQRFSCWMTSMLHVFGGGFADRLHEAELDHLLPSQAARVPLAGNYVGLPY